MIRDIFNTYREAFRLWVRNHTRPKSIHEAEEKRLFWSKCYLFFVTCGIGMYFLQSYRAGVNLGGDKDVPMALRLARSMNETEPVRIIKYSGFTRVSDRTHNVKELEKVNSLHEEETSAPKVS